jgi:ABC-2 type transport system ATP-binding protein
MIDVVNLCKTYEYYKKDTGLKNSFKNLFHRKKLYKNAVKDISFTIEEGEFVGFLGPNGAGKTTTLKMLSGILHPTSGNARVMGYVPWERNNEFKRNFSIVMGQKNQLWWDLPTNESLLLNKCIYEIDDSKYNNTLNELVEVLDVKDLLKIQVRRLSLGERMKMEIIAALIHRPKIILLDEPTIGLDLVSQRNIREFLKYYNTTYKATIILTSHYMKDIEELCTRTIIINKGQSVYDGKITEINGVLKDAKIIKIRFSTHIDKDVLSQIGRIREYAGDYVVLEVDKTRLNEHSKTIMNDMPVVDLNIEEIPLDEAIEAIYNNHDGG